VSSISGRYPAHPYVFGKSGEVVGSVGVSGIRFLGVRKLFKMRRLRAPLYLVFIRSWLVLSIRNSVNKICYHKGTRVSRAILRLKGISV
jgi:hypothetical protein